MDSNLCVPGVRYGPLGSSWPQFQYHQAPWFLWAQLAEIVSWSRSYVEKFIPFAQCGPWTVSAVNKAQYFLTTISRRHFAENHLYTYNPMLFVLKIFKTYKHLLATIMNNHFKRNNLSVCCLSVAFETSSQKQNSLI